MKGTINVLIPDGESTWAINVIQCLGGFPYDIHVLSRKKKTASKYSKFTTTFTYCKDAKIEEDWMSIILAEVQRKNIHVILPIAEKEMLFLKTYESRIKEFTKIIALPPVQGLEVSLNKGKFYEFFKSNGLSYPKTAIVDRRGVIRDLIDDISFPVLIKPFQGKGGEGIIRFDNELDLQTFFKENPTGNFVVQEYIDGYDIDCSVFCEDGSIKVYTIQKGMIPNQDPYAPQLGVLFVDNEEVLELISSLMKTLNWNGIAHIDLRFNDKTGRYHILEINARFWGSLEASKKMGVNFADIVIKDILDIPVGAQNYRKELVVIFNRLIKQIAQQPRMLLRFKFLFKHFKIGLFLNDPIPTIFRFQEWFNRRVHVNK